jgi:hypothetical protein
MSTVVNKTTFQVLTGVNTPDFPTASWLINPAGLAALLAGSVPTRYWKLISGDTDVGEMTALEKAVVDSDPTLLAAAKTAMIDRLVTAAITYTESRYSPDERARFALLFNQDRTLVALPSARKIALFAQFDWEQSVYAEMSSRATTVNAALTIPAVLAVSTDFTSFNATDPNTTLPSLMLLSTVVI